MSDQRRTAQSFVGYIERSARYYEAQGYSRRYAWAHFDEVPFTRPRKPLAESRLGVVTTSYFTSPAAPVTSFLDRPDQPYAVPLERAIDLDNAELFWAKDETHTEDPETFLPLARLGELVARHRLGELSPRFYGVPTGYSQRRTITQDAPAVAEFMSADAIDVALLVPL